VSSRFIPLSVVLDRVCLSKSELYRKIQAGEFPPAIPLGPQKVVFLEAEVERWMAERLQARENGEGADWRRSRALRAAEARR
jgi:prophage regulatory protein